MLKAFLERFFPKKFVRDDELALLSISNGITNYSQMTYKVTNLVRYQTDIEYRDEIYFGSIHDASTDCDQIFEFYRSMVFYVHIVDSIFEDIFIKEIGQHLDKEYCLKDGMEDRMKAYDLVKEKFSLENHESDLREIRAICDRAITLISLHMLHLNSQHTR